MGVIQISHFTKDYGQRKGVFDISLHIQKGEIYGYLGPNGAGKSTTMRHLMGFGKAQSGTLSINGEDCWKAQKTIQKTLGYLPGEIAFPDDMSGWEYIKLIAKMRDMKDFSYAETLLKRFELDPHTSLKRMSKGMKQKIGIVTAFMHDPDILLLDEPTSGLDPLMQNRFIELIMEEKHKGKTILLSSHIFEEVEKTSDRIGMIRGGELIKEFTIDELRHNQHKTYKVAFFKDEDIQSMMKLYPSAIYRANQKQLIITITDEQVNAFIKALSTYQIRYLKEEKHTLEEYFMQFYGDEHHV